MYLSIVLQSVNHPLFSVFAVLYKLFSLFTPPRRWPIYGILTVGIRQTGKRSLNPTIEFTWGFTPMTPPRFAQPWAEIQRLYNPDLLLLVGEILPAACSRFVFPLRAPTYTYMRTFPSLPRRERVANLPFVRVKTFSCSDKWFSVYADFFFKSCQLLKTSSPDPTYPWVFFFPGSATAPFVSLLRKTDSQPHSTGDRVGPIPIEYLPRSGLRFIRWLLQFCGAFRFHFYNPAAQSSGEVKIHFGVLNSLSIISSFA
jgi:hypothetical protein